MDSSKGRKLKGGLSSIYIKPLSVNVCWNGRKVKSHKYREYEREVLSILPDQISIPDKGKLMIYIKFAHSNSAFDWDNGIKPFQDILQKKYLFNDRQIYFAIVEKEVVNKGDEYITFCVRKMGILDKIHSCIRGIFK